MTNNAEREAFESAYWALITRPDILHYNNPHDLPTDNDLKGAMWFGWKLARAQASGVPDGTSSCPICGLETPHQHSYEDELKYRSRQGSMLRDQWLCTHPDDGLGSFDQGRILDHEGKLLGVVLGRDQSENMVALHNKTARKVYQLETAVSAAPTPPKSASVPDATTNPNEISSKLVASVPVERLEGVLRRLEGEKVFDSDLFDLIRFDLAELIAEYK
jgi:hypothetical protein